MGSPAVPNDAQLAQMFARARAFVLAVEGDEDNELTEALEVLPDHVANHVETVAHMFAQLVVLLAGGLAPVADAIETMAARPPSKGRVVAACAVNREWFRATEDNSAEAMRLIAKLARKEPS